MTTFTTDDREEEYKKIVAAAPNQPGYEDAIPIPFAGMVMLTEPKYKELTDEEIQEIAHGFGAIGWMGDTTYEFARAILRKAQEKWKK